MVDYVCILHDPQSLVAIDALRPDVFAKGKEYQELESPHTVDEKELLESYGARYHFTETEEFSSTKLGHLSGLMTYAQEQGPLADQTFVDLSPTDYQLTELRRFIKKARELNVLVIGELITDKWVFDNITGYSVHGKCVVGKTQRQVVQDGGASIVSRHIEQFVKNVDVMGSHGPIVKTRFLNADNETPIYGHEVIRPKPLKNKINYRNYDMVVIADFGHGFIDKWAAQEISTECPVFMAVQAQTNTDNFGFNIIDKYPRADYFNMNRQEASLLVKEDVGAEKLVRESSDALDGFYTTVTDGAMGAYIGDGEEYHFCPALSTSVVEATGCGDAFFALCALALKLEMRLPTALLLGSIGGAIMSQKLGNMEPITVKEVEQLWKVVT
jgi:bifunctional ADP-heptose synthase (sugar kinase/adenylyltransferase)